ncbi:MAG: hypothetical protein Q4Q62_06005 [Thermoplasmata archaeon]|nr:hypothetical protein [Thermoplasmata archaeon]
MSSIRAPRQLEDWDRDGMYLRSIAKAEQIAREGGLAIQAALDSHPVTKYVKNCEIEDLYGPDRWHPAISDSYFQEGCQTPKQYVEWGLPMRDEVLPERMGCGFKWQSPAEMRFTACGSDRSHYLKAARIHCWRLACANCGNDVALRRGAQVETRILAYADLEKRGGRKVPQLKHWVISPPQEWTIEVMRDVDRFALLVQWVQLVMIDAGFLGGAMVFHPWRLQDEEWVLGPHFHVIGYGYVDNRRIYRKYGCVVKQVHPGEKIRSVRQTIAYLLTHAGLGYSERPEDEINWDLSVLSHFIPGLMSGDDSSFSDTDWFEAGEGRGRMVGDLSEFDWVQWTMRRYTKTFNAVRTFGVVARKHIRVFDVYREDRVRLCPECGAELMIYDGFDDRDPKPSRYIHDSPIMVLAEEYDMVHAAWKHWKADLQENGVRVLDFALRLEACSTPQSMGLDDYDSERAVSIRQESRRLMRYVPSQSGQGLDPMLMTPEQARIFDETGLLPDEIPAGSPLSVQGNGAAV